MFTRVNRSLALAGAAVALVLAGQAQAQDVLYPPVGQVYRARFTVAAVTTRVCLYPADAPAQDPALACLDTSGDDPGQAHDLEFQASLSQDTSVVAVAFRDWSTAEPPLQSLPSNQALLLVVPPPPVLQ